MRHPKSIETESQSLIGDSPKKNLRHSSSEYFFHRINAINSGPVTIRRSERRAPASVVSIDSSSSYSFVESSSFLSDIKTYSSKGVGKGKLNDAGDAPLISTRDKDVLGHSADPREQDNTISYVGKETSNELNVGVSVGVLEGTDENLSSVYDSRHPIHKKHLGNKSRIYESQKDPGVSPVYGFYNRKNSHGDYHHGLGSTDYMSILRDKGEAYVNSFIHVGMCNGISIPNNLDVDDSSNIQELNSIFMADETKLPIYIAAFGSGFFSVVIFLCTILYIKFFFSKLRGIRGKGRQKEDSDSLLAGKSLLLGSTINREENLAEIRSRNPYLTRIEDYMKDYHEKWNEDKNVDKTGKYGLPDDEGNRPDEFLRAFCGSRDFQSHKIQENGNSKMGTLKTSESYESDSSSSSADSGTSETETETESESDDGSSCCSSETENST